MRCVTLISNLLKYAIFAAAFAIVSASTGAEAAQIIYFNDFSKSDQGWKGNGFLQKAGISPDGLKLVGLGIGPLLSSPEIECPKNGHVLVSFKMKSKGDTAGAAFLGSKYDERSRTRVALNPDGEWHEYSLFLKPADENPRLWIAPFGNDGKATIAWVRIVDATAITPPVGTKPSRAKQGTKEAARLKSGNAAFVQYADEFDSFAIIAAGKETASGGRADRIGLLIGDSPEWLPLSAAKFNVKKAKNSIDAVAVLDESTGARLTLTRHVSPGNIPGSFDVSVTLKSDSDLDVVHVPWLTLLPGLGTFGGSKKQALFAGLEYLADEPSSSEADLRGAQADRHAPDKVKITFPLMTICAKGAYVGVIWNESPDVAAVFDSPDRSFGSGSHLIALWAPGVGAVRRENDLYAFDSFTLEANKPVIVKYTIIAGAGDSIIPAVKQYVALKGLPHVPKFPGGLDETVKMLAHGWLDSGISDNGKWRHALWGSNFPPQISAESAALMIQLANLTGDSDLSKRLRTGAARGLEVSTPQDPNFRSGVSHVRLPKEQMLFGKLREFLKDYTAGQSTIASQFDAQGIRRYVASTGRLDYSSTHFADHASGYGAAALFPMLEAAWLSGDPALTNKSLSLLDMQTTLYKNAEPRGAQTWEIPLHTPDILASAYLVKAYVLGYAMTGKKTYLDEARYWAWTGIPFVYLRPPAEGSVGDYSTIAVYGATSWESPNWIGLPVQWCGLVYASALHQLAKYDTSGPWAKVAEGITATGLLMSYPADDAVHGGLLPDSYNLKTQTRNGPDINPGTVQAHFTELFGKGKLYDFTRLAKHGWHISAPCEISRVKEDAHVAQFSIAGFGSEKYSVLISLIGKKPRAVLVNGLKRSEFKYDPAMKILIIEGLKGPAKLAIQN